MRSEFTGWQQQLIEYAATQFGIKLRIYGRSVTDDGSERVSCLPACLALLRPEPDRNIITLIIPAKLGSDQLRVVKYERTEDGSIKSANGLVADIFGVISYLTELLETTDPALVGSLSYREIESLL